MTHIVQEYKITACSNETCKLNGSGGNFKKENNCGLNSIHLLCS
jgi:hypothetical protein